MSEAKKAHVNVDDIPGLEQRQWHTPSAETPSLNVDGLSMKAATTNSNTNGPDMSGSDVRGTDMDMNMNIDLDTDQMLEPNFEMDSQEYHPMNVFNSFPHADASHELISLGLLEPLPPDDMVEELHQIYFAHVAPTASMIHKYRYFMQMALAPNARPPACLRYAMWSMAATVSDKYKHLAEIFYERARRYAEMVEMKGHGEHFATIAVAQTWILIGMFEAKMAIFTRAWMTSGKSVRLVYMLGLQRVDGGSLQRLDGSRNQFVCLWFLATWGFLLRTEADDCRNGYWLRQKTGSNWKSGEGFSGELSMRIDGRVPGRAGQCSLTKATSSLICLLRKKPSTRGSKRLG